ncbi:MAG: glycosyltransferase family 4 protein [Deltaproteobacteria bacterium]|nr:glycosyltransferase family 4 protein [Deltaproteobacteria bacterium]
MTDKRNSRVAILLDTEPSEELRKKIDAGTAPRRDYFMLQEHYGATLLFPESKTVLGEFLYKFAKIDLDSALVGYRNRKDYDLVITVSEQIGLPLGALLNFSRSKMKHVLLAHQPAIWKKIIFMYLTGAYRGIDSFVCYGKKQATLLKKRLVFVKEAQVSVILHPADHLFWKPKGKRKEREILTAGLEYRDYSTFLDAIDGLDVDVFIAASSPWSRRKDETRQREIPANTKVGRLEQHELKKKLEEATIVVVPLKPVDFQAGSLVMYEAMACGNAVVATRTASHAEGEIIQDGENGLLVPPCNAKALRDAILRLIEDDNFRARLGRAARNTVEQGLNLDKYMAQLTSLVDSFLDR